jgi:uncharacterized protein
VAPVKGMALAEREAVELTTGGVLEDRRFFVIDARNRMVNGKRLGTLVQVRPEVGDDELTLHFPAGPVRGPIACGEPFYTQFFGRPREVREVLGPFAPALSEHVGEPVRLVAPTSPAMDRGRAGAFSLLSAAACAPHDPRRFRMLFGVDGVPAHAEDAWLGRRVRVGDAVVEPRSHTGRCLVTSQDPDTGIADMDMLDLIRRTRPDLGTEPLPFGVHGVVVEPGVVRVGDVVALDP